DHFDRVEAKVGIGEDRRHRRNKTHRRREPDSNHRSLLYDKHPNWLEKAPELCAQGQPRCVRTREMLGRSRYPNNRMARQGPSSCPNALPNPARGTLGVRAQSAYLGMKW